jgi:hypothetical protein
MYLEGEDGPTDYTYIKAKHSSLSSNGKARSPPNFKRRYMYELDSTGSEYLWSIVGPTGSTLSVRLPKKINNFRDFMAVDIATGDSDPVYWAVTAARHKWGYPWATRFSVAMLAYYHTGVAAQAAEYEGEEFWDYLIHNFPHLPRGAARRHLRGSPGLGALKCMESLSPNPDKFFEQFPQIYAGVRATCEKRLAQFGPYFQLKVCDFMDRCLTMPIRDYRGLAKNLPGEPAKALDAMFPNCKVEYAFNGLCEEAATWNILAAPLFDRPAGPAEVETSLCGWKTTGWKGNWFGADIIDKRQALAGYGDKALEMIGMMPPAIPKNLFVCEGWGRL